jgi:hypothetical protein
MKECLMNDHTFALCDNQIVCWNGNSNTWTPIATIIEQRQCARLVRFSYLAYAVELLMDKFIGATAGTNAAICDIIDAQKED